MQLIISYHLCSTTSVFLSHYMITVCLIVLRRFLSVSPAACFMLSTPDHNLSTDPLYSVSVPSSQPSPSSHLRSFTAPQILPPQTVFTLWTRLPVLTGLYFYRVMHFSANRGLAIACRLSVCPSVCLSVTLVDCDHINWNSSEIISPLVSLGCSLSADLNIRGLLQG